MAIFPLAEIPARGAALHGHDAWAIRHGDDVISWGDLADRATRRAHALRAAGVEPGDLVTLALPNGSAFYELMFALWTIGATPHVVSYRLPLAELQAIVAVAGPRMVIASDEALRRAFGAQPADFGRGHADTTPLEAVIAPRWKAMSSGGSTGRPKIIVAPGPNTFDTERKPPLRFPADGPILATGPVYHNMPVTTNIQALSEGHSVIGMTRFDPEEALRLIETFGIKWTSFVPTMMMRISRLPKEVRDKYDVSSLETVWHWAAPMPPELKQEWIDWIGPEKIWELYGGTEGIVTTILNGVEWLAHRGSVGRALLDKIKIVDEAGNELPRGEVGEIFALPAGGRGSTYSYIGADARVTDDGFETLGDFGWMDQEGYLYIADRRTDMIVSGGANIFPAEVEGALMAHPGVQGAVVIGLPDSDFGAATHAIIQPTDGAQGHLTSDELLSFLRERLVAYKLPRSFEFVTDMLRDDAGKVRRQQLREARIAPSNDGESDPRSAVA
ncbi:MULTISPECIES: AMP-binding protein [Sphingobium]|uniref:AMP-binding protein n=1 Tax=Sphingobium sp. MI1205 TaxID=407020 RepID=UPI000770028B|nr:AMP-binding protein [Sphingobium sp. MI1205]AMK20449.1 putative acyl-CoA ligase [Sphingobium sp. MI1205]